MEIKDLLMDSRWSKALYINERINSYNFDNRNSNNYNEGLQKWLDLFKNNKKLLNYRMKDYGVNLNQFNQITQDDICNCDLFKFKWYKELYKTFTETNNFPIDKFIKLNNISFGEFLVPFIRRSINVMNNELQNFNKEININKLIEINVEILSICISNLSIKTLISELNKCRINNELSGNTAYERYKNFIDLKLTNNNDILNLLIQYPVMARLISETIININTNIIDVIKNFIKDKSELENYFQVKLKEIDSIHVMGDFHNCKKCVLKLKFKNNNNIIYKPRDLSIDKNFQKLLVWFNEHGMCKKFKTIKLLNKEEYGWEQFVLHNKCKNNEDVKNFFQRQGQYLALMYILNARDMHFENIIADGQYPVFIDLESLLGNESCYLSNDEIKDYRNIYKDSVLRTSMLPTSNINNIYNSDICGIAGDNEQIVNTYKINDKNTDIMSIKKTCIKINTSNHLPNINGKCITPKFYIEDIKKGFKDCYYIILNNANDFIDIVSKLFIGNFSRVILRPTIIYKTLLEVSTNPKYLKSGIERSCIIDYTWCILNKYPKRIQTVKYENYDLLNGDIPFFCYKVGQNNLIHKNGEILNYFKKDIISEIIHKVDLMNNENFNVQYNIIELSIKEKYFPKKVNTNN